MAFSYVAQMREIRIYQERSLYWPLLPGFPPTSFLAPTSLPPPRLKRFHLFPPHTTKLPLPLPPHIITPYPPPNERGKTQSVYRSRKRNPLFSRQRFLAAYFFPSFLLPTHPSLFAVSSVSLEGGYYHHTLPRFPFSLVFMIGERAAFELASPPLTLISPTPITSRTIPQKPKCT